MDARPEDQTTIAPAGLPPTTSPEEAEQAPTLPVAGAGPGPGSSRARWLIGGGLAVAAVAVLAIAAILLGARPLPEVLKYAPADSAVVVELRPELPGDQRQHLGNFLAHFPGFDDQSILDDKIDEALERLLESGGGGLDYRAQVKPLLGGPMVVALTADAVEGMAAEAGSGDGILVVATTDGSATCESIFDAGAVAATHREVEIREIAGEVSCALHGRHLLTGTVDTIKAAIDARLDNAGIDTNDRYTSARDRLEGDRLATAFVDASAVMGSLSGPLEAFGQPVLELPEDLWIMQGLRVEDDALVLDVYGPETAGDALPSGAPTSAPAAQSTFAQVLPSGTLGYLEVHGVGAALLQGLAAMRADPAQADAVAQVEAALGALGGAETFAGWIEDLGLAIVPTDDGIGSALLLRGASAEAAAARVAQLRNLLVLGSIGTDITVEDRDHGGVMITSVDLGDLSSLMEGLGGLGGLPVDPGLPIPGDSDDVRLAFDVAVRDDLVVVAFGGGAVEAILDVDAGSSLATTATYGRAIDLAGSRNSAQLYVALDSALELATTFLTGEELAAFEADAKPYLEPLAGLAMSSTTSPDGSHARFVFSVK